MKQTEYERLKDGDRLKLNFASQKEFKGRFNSYDYYRVFLSRNGKYIKDDSGCIRFLNDIFKHFHGIDKWN